MSVLNAVKAVPEVCSVWCATANHVAAVVASCDGGRAVAAVFDGKAPVGVEGGADIAQRHQLLRDLGYKP